jgi:uncharacterized protein YqgV (UPF0045/DUF77 family)
MIGISAQVSLYPLGQSDLAPAINAVLAVLDRWQLTYQVGSMSTVVWGDDDTLFRALHDAFAAAVAYGPSVMSVTFSNACPVPQQPVGEPHHE